MLRRPRRRPLRGSPGERGPHRRRSDPSIRHGGSGVSHTADTAAFAAVLVPRSQRAATTTRVRQRTGAWVGEDKRAPLAPLSLLERAFFVPPSLSAFVCRAGRNGPAVLVVFGLETGTDRRAFPTFFFADFPFSPLVIFRRPCARSVLSTRACGVSPRKARAGGCDHHLGENSCSRSFQPLRTPHIEACLRSTWFRCDPEALPRQSRLHHRRRRRRWGSRFAAARRPSRRLRPLAARSRPGRKSPSRPTARSAKWQKKRRHQ